MRWQYLSRKKIYEVANVNKQHAAYLQYLPIPMSKDSAKKSLSAKTIRTKRQRKKKKKNKNKNRWMINVCRYLTFNKIRSKEEHYARPKCLQEERASVQQKRTSIACNTWQLPYGYSIFFILFCTFILLLLMFLDYISVENWKQHSKNALNIY